MINLNEMVLKMINKYKAKTEGHPHSCRYVPTCSTYSRQAFTEYNFFYAALLTLIRLLKCNPLTKPKVNQIPKYKNCQLYLFENNLTITKYQNNDIFVKHFNRTVGHATINIHETWIEILIYCDIFFFETSEMLTKFYEKEYPNKTVVTRKNKNIIQVM